MNFTEQEPEIISLQRSEPVAPSPFVFEDVESENVEDILQNRETRKETMRQTLGTEDVSDDIREPFASDIERIDREISSATTDKEVARLEAEVADLQQKIQQMELARGPQGSKGERGPAGKSVDKDTVVSEVAEKVVKTVEKKIPSTRDFIKLIKSLIQKPQKGERGESGSDGKDGRDGSPDTGEQIVIKVNGLDVDPKKQIDFRHIKNFPWHKVREEGERGSLASWGNPVSIEVPTGTIDDSNTAFVFTKEPTLISINGSLYSNASTVGGTVVWTWSGSTATLAFPVGTGGDVYGVIF